MRNSQDTFQSKWLKCNQHVWASLGEVVPGQSSHLNGGRRVCVTQGGVICCNNAVRLLSVVFSVGKSHPDCSARMKTGSCCTCTDSAHNAVCHVYSAFPLSKVFCIVQSRSTVSAVFSCSSAHPELPLSLSILSRCRIFLRLEAFLPRLFFYYYDDYYYYYYYH